MSAKITISHIANRLNITAATVSRALNDHPAISDGTKRAVRKMADKLNYKRNNLASSLRSGRSHIVGVLIPSVDINFFASVIHGIEALANEHNYRVLIYQSNESESDEQKGVETFIGARVDGILASVAKSTMNFSHYREVTERNIPLVIFDRSADVLKVPSVCIDDFKGGFMATEHLLRKGYKRVAHVSGPNHLPIFRERLRGYREALRQYAPGSGELVFPGNVGIDSGRAAVDYFFSLEEPPDAIFAVEDFTALGVVKELERRGIGIPHQMGVMGFANESFGQYITPGLSTIDQQTSKMGREAFELLFGLMRPAEREQGASNIILDPVLIERGSTQR